MIFTNSYNIELTGTNFGLLNQYPASVYKYGYFFNDLFLNPNVTYGETLSTNGFLDFYTTSSEISSISGLLVWLDAQDATFLRTRNSAVTSIRDKSTYSNIFSCISGISDELLNVSTACVSAIWPLTGSSLQSKRCVRIAKNNSFFNDKFKVNLNKPFSLYFIWKDNNLINYSIPFSLMTEYNTLTSEILAINQYVTNDLLPEQLQWGLRNVQSGMRIPSVSGAFFEPNLFNWNYNGTDFLNITSLSLDINNLQYDINRNIILSGAPVLTGSNVGYLTGGNNNDFFFGEMLVFDRILNWAEHVKLVNTLYNKWNLYTLFTDNLTASSYISGGMLNNFSYEDYSVLTSTYEIPTQGCVTRITVGLKNFDSSVSKISKVLYEHNNKLVEIPATFTNNVTSFDIRLEKDETDFIIIPDNEKQLSTYAIGLSVFRYDSTINKLVLSGNIARCSIIDAYSNTSLIDSQILDNPKKILLVTENKTDALLQNNVLDVTLPLQALSGGEIEPLFNKEAQGELDEIILLSDLLEDEDQAVEEFKTPGIIPVPAPRINPIRPGG